MNKDFTKLLNLLDDDEFYPKIPMKRERKDSHTKEKRDMEYQKKPRTIFEALENIVNLVEEYCQ